MRPRRSAPSHGFRLVVAALAASAAVAQQQQAPDPSPEAPPATPPPATPGAPSPSAPQLPAADRALRAEDIPPQLRLGLRAALIGQKIPTRSAVVVVTDPGAYVDAIASWSLESRFPVLLDDGTDAAREDIARFVRAFEPTHVLRWSGAEGAPAWSAQAAAERRTRVDSAVASAWGTLAGKPEVLGAQWKSIGFEPPGAVVASEADPAWTGALALAAGRGQPIIWVDRSGPEPLGATLDQQGLVSWKALLEERLDATKYAWRGMGDAIDAVTICLSLPTKVMLGGQVLALTDCLGRVEGQPPQNNTVLRSYCVGIAPGSEPRAAYRAMCALFLQPKKAWLFEGYTPDPTDPKKAVFGQYAIEPAARVLNASGIDSLTDDEPRDPLALWRRRVSGGVNYGLIHVNSAGTRDWFMLKNAKVDANEVPASLERPALVHFVHSFSAQDPGDANSIAARWLDAGAYAYVGSADEPFLTAFHTPEHLAGRLLAPAPWGFAARVDAPQPWKINVFGDPLITVVPPTGATGAVAARLPDAPPLAGVEDVAEHFKTALKDRKFDDAARDLAYLSRDADILRVFSSAKGEQAVTPGLASAAFWAAGRSGMIDLAFEAYNRLDDERAQSGPVVDALWQWGRAGLEMSPTRAMIDALKTRLRAPTLPDDAVAVAKAIRKVDGAEKAREFCNVVVSAIADPAAREKVQERLRIF